MSFFSWLGSFFSFGSRRDPYWMDAHASSASTRRLDDDWPTPRRSDDDWMDNTFSSFDQSWDTASSSITKINPATGLPMCGGIGGFDVAGNPYGFDNSSTFDDCSSASGSMFDDCSSSSSSMFDDWGSSSCSSSSSFDDWSSSSSSSCGSSFDDW